MHTNTKLTFKQWPSCTGAQSQRWAGFRIFVKRIPRNGGRSSIQLNYRYFPERLWRFTQIVVRKQVKYGTRKCHQINQKLILSEIQRQESVMHPISTLVGRQKEHANNCWVFRLKFEFRRSCYLHNEVIQVLHSILELWGYARNRPPVDSVVSSLNSDILVQPKRP